jgi:spermidine/putrescine transport system permease protein
VTFPLFVYGAKQRGFPPQVFVIGTLMFFISFVFVIGGELWRRRSAVTGRT